MADSNEPAIPPLWLHVTVVFNAKNAITILYYEFFHTFAADDNCNLVARLFSNIKEEIGKIGDIDMENLHIP